MNSEDNLQKLEHATLDERRNRDDMITPFNCVTGRRKLDKKDFIILNI